MQTNPNKPRERDPRTGRYLRDDEEGRGPLADALRLIPEAIAKLRAVDPDAPAAEWRRAYGDALDAIAAVAAGLSTPQAPEPPATAFVLDGWMWPSLDEVYAITGRPDGSWRPCTTCGELIPPAWQIVTEPYAFHVDGSVGCVTAFLLLRVDRPRVMWRASWTRLLARLAA
jgi:hypothetical protein